MFLHPEGFVECVHLLRAVQLNAVDERLHLFDLEELVFRHRLGGQRTDMKIRRKNGFRTRQERFNPVGILPLSCQG